MCDWCGEEFVYVWIDAFTPTGSPMRLNAEPSDPWTRDLAYTRVHPDQCGGRIDVVRRVTDEERMKITKPYVAHKDTCPQAGKWAGQKKARSYAPPEREGPIQEGEPDGTVR